MDYRTKVELPKKEVTISHKARIMVMGSCFSEHIGERLQQARFRCMVNPYGVLYNPGSIAQALKEIADGKQYEKDDLKKGNDGLWHSMMHHGSFSAPTPEECLDKINNSLKAATKFLRETDFLILTLGTSFAYFLKGQIDPLSDPVMGNCHHFPESMFDRRNLDIYCGSFLLDIMGYVQEVNPKIRVIFTVSPVRHLKDGLHANQISKACLLLGVEEALARIKYDVYYFPAYEIMMDELRDYRFYADDMLHPSKMAIDYIWECFQECYFDKDTLTAIKQWEDVRLNLEHRPLHPETAEYKKFLCQTLLKMKQLQKKFPYFGLEKEIAQLEEKISAF